MARPPVRHGPQRHFSPTDTVLVPSHVVTVISLPTVSLRHAQAPRPHAHSTHIPGPARRGSCKNGRGTHAQSTDWQPLGIDVTIPTEVPQPKPECHLPGVAQCLQAPPRYKGQHPLILQPVTQSQQRPRHEKENSRNKKFQSFTLHGVLSSMMKSPAKDVTLPCAQRPRAVQAPRLSVMQSACRLSERATTVPSASVQDVVVIVLVAHGYCSSVRVRGSGETPAVSPPCLV